MHGALVVLEHHSARHQRLEERVLLLRERHDVRASGGIWAPRGAAGARSSAGTIETTGFEAKRTAGAIGDARVEQGPSGRETEGRAPKCEDPAPRAPSPAEVPRRNFESGGDLRRHDGA